MEIIDSFEKPLSETSTFSHVHPVSSVEFHLTSILLSKLKGTSLEARHDFSILSLKASLVTAGFNTLLQVC